MLGVPAVEAVSSDRELQIAVMVVVISTRDGRDVMRCMRSVYRATYVSEIREAQRFCAKKD